MDRAKQVSAEARDWLLQCGERYWGLAQERVTALSLPIASGETGRLVPVPLPNFALDLGVGHPPSIMVDSGCLVAGDGPPWRRCDWWRAAFLFLTGAAEQRHESSHGPIHSYSFRLKVADHQAYERAWVNRIFLFLRRLAAHSLDLPEEGIFGPLPAASFDLTHDVDAVSKTLPIRIKQSTFQLFNSARLARRRQWRRAGETFARTGRFLFSQDDYWKFDEITRLEAERGLRSVFHVYGGVDLPWRSWLLDPGYTLRDPAVARKLIELREHGWEIGLHPGVRCWSDDSRLTAERRAVERAIGAPVGRCRQHWLRFSWAQTWRAQEAAGLTTDSTLCFNDRPGFRNSAAIRHRPWDSTRNAPLKIEVLPMVMMDSHFYDYGLIDRDRIEEQIKYWIGEMRSVRGVASVNWHVHVLSRDYGWTPGLRMVLDAIV